MSQVLETFQKLLMKDVKPEDLAAPQGTVYADAGPCDYVWQKDGTLVVHANWRINEFSVLYQIFPDGTDKVLAEMTGYSSREAFEDYARLAQGFGILV